MMPVLACGILLHELGKVPVMLLLLTDSSRNCGTATELIVLVDMP